MLPNEKLLQFIWQHSLYRPVDLCTTHGEKITILFPGMLNTDAGPDFSEAKIKIGNTTFVGNVELHLKTSDWLKHRHDTDDAYKNIILHVVYENDTSLLENIFTIELQNNISNAVIERYKDLMHTLHPIPCSSQLAKVNAITKESQLSRMLAERWDEKLKGWKQILQQNTTDWKELFYIRLAANFGFKVNEAPFIHLAQSLPYTILAKHKHSLLQIEALFFGQAGMLSKNFAEEYPKALQKEYGFLQKKYKITPIKAHLWKFLRLRPNNFPTLRIAQLASLVYKANHLFSEIITENDPQKILELFKVSASSYWDYHYNFEQSHTSQKEKRLGKASVYNIIINTIAPIKFLYAQAQQTTVEQENAIRLIENIPPEKNKKTAIWEQAGWRAFNAAHSQGLIQLYDNYCSKKRCLQCAIGLNLIKKEIT